jgi:hypothetical protein
MTKPAPPAAVPAAGRTAALPPALAHLFRHSLLEGRVHPLLHIVQRYRLEKRR